MKKLICFLMVMMSVGYTAHAQSDDACVEDNLSYQAGEEVHYQVFYKWGLMNAHAGNVSFKCEETTYQDESAYHITAVGKTLSTYEWFYKVKDVYETWIDQATGLPLKFKRDVNEGGYRIAQEYTFDNPENQATIVKSVVNGNTKISNKKYDISQCAQDVLSAIYRCRNIDFKNKKNGDKIKLNFFIDGDMYNSQLTILARENVKTKMGTYKCVKFKATLVKGTIFEGDEELTVWATDDANKVPILIEAPIVVGRVRAVISGWSGLRNPISSKL